MTDSRRQWSYHPPYDDGYDENAALDAIFLPTPAASETADAALLVRMGARLHEETWHIQDEDVAGVLAAIRSTPTPLEYDRCEQTHARGTTHYHPLRVSRLIKERQKVIDATPTPDATDAAWSEGRTVGMQVEAALKQENDILRRLVRSQDATDAGSRDLAAWMLGRAHDGETYDGEWWPQVWPHGGAPVADLNRRIGAKHKDAAAAAFIVAAVNYVRSRLGKRP